MIIEPKRTSGGFLNKILTGEICITVFVLKISGLLCPATVYNNTYPHRGPRNDDATETRILPMLHSCQLYFKLYNLQPAKQSAQQHADNQ